VHRSAIPLSYLPSHPSGFLWGGPLSYARVPNDEEPFFPRCSHPVPPCCAHFSRLTPSYLVYVYSDPFFFVYASQLCPVLNDSNTLLFFPAMTGNPLHLCAAFQQCPIQPTERLSRPIAFSCLPGSAFLSMCSPLILHIRPRFRLLSTPRASNFSLFRFLSCFFSTVPLYDILMAPCPRCMTSPR